MKKVFLCAAIAMIAGSSTYAQSDKVQVGIKAGYNLANLTITDNGTTNDKRSTSSFRVGAYLDFPLISVLSVQPGLFVSGKGSQYTIGDNNSNNYTEVRTNPIYLELPVNAVIKLPLADNADLFLGAGPYAAMGVAGKNRVKGKLLGIGFENDDKIEYSNDDPANGNNGSAFKGNLKRFDAGLNALVGVRVNKLTLDVNYGLGLVNISPGSSNTTNNKYQNRVLSFNVGLLF